MIKSKGNYVERSLGRIFYLQQRGKRGDVSAAPRQRAGEERRAPFCSLRSQKELPGAQGSQQSPSGKLISRRGKCHGTTSPSPPAPPLLAVPCDSHCQPGSESLGGQQSWKGPLLGDCSHSQGRAHPIPCPLPRSL